MKKNELLMTITSFVACAVSIAVFFVSYGNCMSTINEALETRNANKINNQLGRTNHLSTQISPISRLIMKGDEESYDALIRAYNLSGRMDETFAYSLIMAFKYNYSDAYYNIYDNFLNLYGKNTLDSLDDYSKTMALMCLSKAAEMGNYKARKEKDKFHQ